ncbi:proline and serine-rich protein 3 isoform X2 [Myripristis murdjan]|uniref:proline and serine-rich protein 3 isoform X2 n=1 Tax=Myripristis murdjan TaxID=586833 RepID=UPI0011761D07|nr:proline and serine-rich protein 3 isoform X2 [Myripristis murdjan]
MKSSGAVFTKKNPFQPASSLGKTHYHPTRKQCLSKKKRETTLSPVRSNQPAKPPLDSLSPDEQHHLGKPKQLFTSCLHPSADGRATFSESWPSTDLGSSPPNTNIASNMGTPKPAGKSIVPFVQGDQQDSVVAKYIERFRYGRPQSREERRPMASATEEELLPLWWMSPSSLPPSATPTQATDKDDVILPLRDNHPPVALSPGGQLPHDTSPPTCRASLSILLDTSQGDLDDTEILQLQERASRLLQKSECSASDGSIPISSEGLGCSDFSSPVSVDEPVRKPYIPSLKEPTTGGHSQKSSVTSPLVQHTRPEEDILFQWRLRRKMEKARQWPQCQGYSSHHHSTFSWQNPGVHQPFVSGQPHEKDNKEAHGPCPSATDSPPSPPFPVSSPLVSKLQSGAQVPAHMHLLCDVLPCPTQASHHSTRQRCSQHLDDLRTKASPPKTQSANSTDMCSSASTEEPISKHMSSPPFASSGTTEEEWPVHHRRAESNNKEKAQTKPSEKNEKRMPVRKQKKSARHIGDCDRADGPSHTNRNSSSHSRGPKKVTPCTEPPASRNGGPKESCQGFSSESCAGDHAPPPSPIHSVLGQVVSEVLFPTLESSSAPKTPVSSDSGSYPPSAPPQSPVPPGGAQNPVEVISQLLQEAEDSDEKEFEDDPLLQVLRKQRKWVKKQISEVDSLLVEFQDEKWGV